MPPIGSPVVPRIEAVAASGSPSEIKEDVPQQSPSRPPLGSPTIAVEEFSPVTEESKRKLAEAKDRDQSEEEDAHRGRIFGGVPEINIPSLLLNTTFLLLMAAMASIVMLFVYAQTLAVLTQIPLLPHWLQGFSYAVVVVLIALVLSFGVRLIFIYCRLKTTRRIHIAGMDELHSRSHLRLQALKETSAAREHLRDYLAAYPTDKKQLTRLGFTEQQIESMKSYREKLDKDTVYLGETAWIKEFKDGYQSVLDEAANACIKRHALNTGLKTSVSPLAIGDTLIVLYSSFLLIGDLSAIYNLRLGRFATLVVTGWAAIQSVLAGRIEDSSTLDSFNDTVINTFGDNITVIAAKLAKHVPAAIGTVVGSVASLPGGPKGMIVAGVVGKKVTEKISRPIMRALEQALIQGLLLTRLGKRTQSWLRMID